ncbi:hypothetical protein PMAYCL1PPCAC_03247, partial [Pristionchus mayeri]
IELCREHSIRHLFIETRNFRMDSFIEEFATDLINMGVALGLYDNSSDPNNYFKKSKQVWNSLAAELRGDQISLRILTKDDPIFASHQYAFDVSAHIRCQKLDDQPIQPMSPNFLIIDELQVMKLNLSSLPPDIIRNIIRICGDYTDDLRMISPSWNALVLEFFSRPQYGRLERLYLYDDMLKTDKPVERKVRMAAILPGRFSKAVGVG